LVGRYRIADTCFSLKEMANGVEKPIVSRAMQYFKPKLGSFGTMAIMSANVSDTSNAMVVKSGLSITAGHPICVLDKVRIHARKEHSILRLARLSEVTKRDWIFQYMCPYQYFVPGLPVIPALDGQGYVMTGQSFFYETQVASEEWFVARIKEILRMRGHSEASFLRMVEGLKGEILTGESKEERDTHGEEEEEDSPDHLEALRITGHVLRMHTCSRPYVSDHIWSRNGKYVYYDQETPALHLPGDCEDSAWVVYQLHMQLLSEDDWRDPLVRALRSCAAIIGVPCSISGTFVDFNGDKAETGHMFPCGIPFDVFGKAVGGVDFSQEFLVKFGFPMPTTKHANQVAILDGVFRSSMFLRGKPLPSDEKNEAYKVVKQWLDERGEHWDWKWSKYTVNYPMSMAKSYYGMAFRLFTGIFSVMKASYANGRWAKVNYLDYNHSNLNAGNVNTYEPCRSFLVLNSPNKSSEHGAGEEARTLQLGVPVNNLAEEQDSFRLIGITPMPMEVAEMEKQIRRMYDRPIVPLGAFPVDYFPTDKVSKSGQHAVEGKITFHSNKRITIYAYGDIPPEDIADIKARLGNKVEHAVFPYSFSNAIVIKL